jgi:hypothetical protein
MFYAVELRYKDDMHQLDVNNYGTAVHGFKTARERDAWIYEDYSFRAAAKSFDSIVRRAKRNKHPYEGIMYIEGGQLKEEFMEE